MAHRYKVGTYDAEGSYFREFEHDDVLTPDELRVHVIEALVAVGEADRAQHAEMIKEWEAEGKDPAIFSSWNESLGQMAYGDDFRDALLARGFREAVYDAEVRLHGWSHAFGPDDGHEWDEVNDDTLAVQAELRERLGIK